MKSNSNRKYLIYSILLALIVWYYTTMQVDPLVESYINVPIVLKNLSAISSGGKTFDVEEPLVAHVSYYVRTSKTEDMPAGNISAYVDFLELPGEGENNDNKPVQNSSGKVPLKINIEENDSLSNVYIYDISPKELHVRIDDYASKKFPITYRIQGALGKGYTLGNVTLANDTTIISGSKRDIDRIAEVSAVINLADKNATWSDISQVHYYDDQGAEIDSLNVVSSVENVSYLATINVTQEIKVVQYYVGETEDGFGVKSVKITPETINAIYPVTSFNTTKTITLPTIDVTGMSESFTKKVDITGLIDPSTKLVDNIKTVDVEVEIVTSDQLENNQTSNPKSNIIILPRATRSEADN